jgi:phospholipase A1/A2
MKHIMLAFTLTAAAAVAQTPPNTSARTCAAILENTARLACYDQWAQQQNHLQPASASTTVPNNTAAPTPSAAPEAASSPAPIIALTTAGRAVVQPSEISRFWDLDKTSAKEKFQLRGYRPISLSVTTANQVNTLPSSPTNGAPANAIAYRSTEMKINLSVRTKLATGLLHRDDQALSDSLWFGYSQQSYWQLFNSGLSRPFRTTDHEPELIYVFGHDRPLPGGWTYRMSGAGLVHQSNGQSLPLSRSWNRAYVMAAADHITAHGNRFTLQAKAWQRLPEKNAKDDNPDISNFIGRAELAGTWSFDTGSQKDATTHTLGLTLRHSLRSQGRGSMRLEYLRSLGDANSSLRFHTQLFSGYGDSLIDYNRRRTVLSLGLSLVDW